MQAVEMVFPSFIELDLFFTIAFFESVENWLVLNSASFVGADLCVALPVPCKDIELWLTRSPVGATLRGCPGRTWLDTLAGHRECFAKVRPYK